MSFYIYRLQPMLLASLTIPSSTVRRQTCADDACFGSSLNSTNGNSLVETDASNCELEAFHTAAIDPFSITSYAITGVDFSLKMADVYVHLSTRGNVTGIVKTEGLWMSQKFLPLLKEDKAVFAQGYEDAVSHAQGAISELNVAGTDVGIIYLLSKFAANLGINQAAELNGAKLRSLLDGGWSSAMEDVVEQMVIKTALQVKEEVEKEALDHVKKQAKKELANQAAKLAQEELAGKVAASGAWSTVKSVTSMAAQEFVAEGTTRNLMRLIPGVNLVLSIISLANTVAGLSKSIESCGNLKTRMISAAAMLRKDVLYEHCMFLKTQAEDRADESAMWTSLTPRGQQESFWQAWDKFGKALSANALAANTLFKKRCMSPGPVEPLEALYARTCKHIDKSGECCPLSQLSAFWDNERAREAQGNKIPAGVLGPRGFQPIQFSRTVKAVPKNGKVFDWKLSRPANAKGRFVLQGRFKCGAPHPLITSIVSYTTAEPIRWHTNHSIVHWDNGDWQDRIIKAIPTREGEKPRIQSVKGPFEIRSYDAVRTRWGRGRSSKVFDNFEHGTPVFGWDGPHRYLLGSVGGLGAPIVDIGYCIGGKVPGVDWQLILPLMMPEDEKCPERKHSTWGDGGRELCFRKQFHIPPPAYMANSQKVEAQLAKLRDAMEGILGSD